MSMKPTKKRTPKARKEIQAAQTADAIRQPLQPMLAHGRSLSDFEPLMVAEQMLLHACRMGEIAVISEQRPEQATEENTVRAGFLRFLLLGGEYSTPLHECGVRLMGAWVAGELNLENTATASAICCVACTFTEPLILRRSKLQSGLFLMKSEVPGIQGDGFVTTGDVFLLDNFKATGEVRMLDAQIGGGFDCSNGQFDGKDGNALSADGVVITGGVFLNNGFQATGEVRLLGAQIGGDLVCSNGQFDGKQSDALSFDGAAIKGSVFLNNGFQAIGEVRLLGAQIGGRLDCRKGHFDGKEGNALSVDSAEIKSGVFLHDGFQAIGEVRLLDAQVGGHLDCSKGQFDGKGGNALCADGIRVTGGFFFRNLANPVNRVSLASASVGVLVDDADAWGGYLVLDGFTYGSIVGGAPTSATARLAWLDKQRPAMSGLSGAGTDFRPQPWKQLQKVLREMGHAEDARQVAVALEHRLRKAGLIGQSPETLRYWPAWTNRPRRWMYRKLACGFHWGFWALTGYGYRPMRLMLWMLAVWLGCAALYWCAALPQSNVFAPSDPLVFQNPAYAACVPGSAAAKAEQSKPAAAKPIQGAGNWYLCATLPQEYTGFSPLAYSLDVILPLVDLQQQKDWSPMIPTPKAVWWEELRGSGWKHITRMVLWAETLFGWLASLLLVAIVSGLTKRRED